MSILMSLIGLSGLVLGIVLPAISDRFGRKPVVIVASALGILCPLAAIYYQGPIGVLAVLMFFGGAVTGGSTLFFATIPTESVSTRSISTAIGLIVGVSTLVGGVAGPAIAGWGADHWGPQASLILAAGCAALVTLISFGLHETAPRKKNAIAAELALVS